MAEYGYHTNSNTNTNTTSSSDGDNDDSIPGMPDPPSHFSIEDSLSKELLKLSFKDRVAIQEEIHGVRCLAPDESPELIERALEAFDTQLLMEKERRFQKQQQQQPNNPNGSNTNINSNTNTNTNINSNSNTNSNTNRNKDVLRNVKSIFNSPKQQKQQPDCYLNDPNVRLRFLRCECFDGPKAVNRFVGFLELTEELFGEYVADRPIRIIDFNTRREEVALQNSRNQYLPFRDRSGRRIFVGVGNCGLDLEYNLRYKIMIYLHWVASEDVETQQKGVVVVAWPSNEDEFSWEKSIRPRMNQRLRVLQEKNDNSMPLRVTSYQGYYKDTPFFRAMSALYYIGMNSHIRSHYKAHYGEPTELRYALSGYGIPEQLLPLSNTGTVKTANHSRWINALRWENRLALFGDGDDSDNNMEEEEIVDCPRFRDVIFRKGPTYKNNPGNMYFRELIEQTHDQHTKGSRKEKCMITWNIVKEIEAQNGRFLDWSKTREMWIVAKDREKIRKQVAACYKQYNRTVLTFQQQQQRKRTIVDDESPNPQQSRSVLVENKAPAKTVSTTTTTTTINIGTDHNSNSNIKINSKIHGNGKKVDQNLRKYYDSTTHMFPSNSKRRKTFSLFCGSESSFSNSNSSDESFGP